MEVKLFGVDIVKLYNYNLDKAYNFVKDNTDYLVDVDIDKVKDATLVIAWHLAYFIGMFIDFEYVLL